VRTTTAAGTQDKQYVHYRLVITLLLFVLDKTILNTLVTMTLTSVVENSKNQRMIFLRVNVLSRL